MRLRLLLAGLTIAGALVYVALPLESGADPLPGTGAQRVMIVPSVNCTARSDAGACLTWDAAAPQVTVSGSVTAAVSNKLEVYLRPDPDAGAPSVNASGTVGISGTVPVYLRPDPDAGAPSVVASGTVAVSSVAVSGTAWAGTAGGIGKVTHDGMCFSTSCVEVAFAATGAVASSATLTAGRWYEVTVIGDGAGGAVACASTSVLPTYIGCNGNDAGCFVDGGASCYGNMKIKEGSTAHKAFSATNTDAGTATLYFYSLTATATSVTLCPQVPCN